MIKMQSVCPVCEIKVNETNGEFKCPKCAASWKLAAWKKKQSLFKKRPSWWTRNKHEVNKAIIGMTIITALVAGTLLVMEARLAGM